MHRRASTTRPLGRRIAPLAAIALLLCSAGLAIAQDAAAAAPPAQGAPVLSVYAGTGDDGVPAYVDQGVFVANNLWILIAAALVFLMHLGFATVESGLCRAKNTVNILTKNVAIVCIGVLTYWLMGFNLMYPGDAWISGKWLGFAGFLLDPGAAGQTAEYTKGAYTYYADFIFQAMFAATAATIVSGAVAERVKLAPFLIFSVLFVALLYPLTGSWKWGKGWLDEMGFYDFAGSTLVHAVGGFGALAGVLLLGPRHGKYGPDGRVQPIPGHSMPLVTIGVFLLFLGWFGFNGGSVLSADPAAVSFVFTTTTLAGVAGGMAAMLTSWAVGGKPDLSMALNGILAGLVGITAGADVVSVNGAVFIGLIAGAIVVFSVIALDKIRVDDPVGAISVHGVCGVWGTLAAGLFCVATNDDGTAKATVGTQALGALAVSAASFSFALLVFGALKATVGIRVGLDEEVEGLDIGEHGMEAYPGFAFTEPVLPAGRPVAAGDDAIPAPARSDGQKRFSVVVEGPSPRELITVWSELCGSTNGTAAEFKSVYPYVTTVQGNRFRFRGGDPVVMGETLRRLFQGALGAAAPVQARVEA